ncbi:hypothetical protein [Paenibacillus sacheonensis]|uniref:Uncharacterized protein n=1 Tax=Paenibacillus sacheonensis TaxID=742054 RepID=A0A7X5BWG8_9BACL|nr:hypothetical protein [Paenibacillus sacheonensis]MBM7564169.1 Na+/melibiose symporter-like transporter [Paenibacillus sacheonensis]NBC67502.1 hypothetical protein [Paenibacillus sacheonensis]
MNKLPWYSKFFQLTENGFLWISLLIGLAVVVGLIAAFTVFRHRLSGKKLMFMGGQLIVLGAILNLIVDFKYHFPSAAFICILLGVVVSFIGLYRRD